VEDDHADRFTIWFPPITEGLGNTNYGFDSSFKRLSGNPTIIKILPAKRQLRPLQDDLVRMMRYLFENFSEKIYIMIHARFLM
jgi:hypothetical protein